MQKRFYDVLDLAICKAQDAAAQTPSAEAIPLDCCINVTCIAVAVAPVADGGVMAPAQTDRQVV